MLIKQPTVLIQKMPPGVQVVPRNTQLANVQEDITSKLVLSVYVVPLPEQKNKVNKYKSTEYDTTRCTAFKDYSLTQEDRDKYQV